MSIETDFTKKRVLIDLRYSDPKQNGGVSFEIQENACISFCKLHDLDIVETLKHAAVSANKTDLSSSNFLA